MDNNFKVGDIIVAKSHPDIHAVVTFYRNGDEKMDILYQDGSAGEEFVDDWEKTGRHIDLKELLDKIKG